MDSVVVTTGRRLVSIGPKVDKYFLLPLRISAYQPGLGSDVSNHSQSLYFRHIAIHIIPSATSGLVHSNVSRKEEVITHICLRPRNSARAPLNRVSTELELSQGILRRRPRHLELCLARIRLWRNLCVQPVASPSIEDQLSIRNLELSSRNGLAQNCVGRCIVHLGLQIFVEIR